MSRHVQVVWAGRRRHRRWEELCREYRRKISRHVEVSDRPIICKFSGDAKKRLELEGAALQRAVRPRSWVVALDRRGRQFDSEAFAKRLCGLLEGRPHGMTFILGSDLGLPVSVLEASDERLSLGPMTLPHQLARLVLYEQIYRALAIRAGIQYHREPLA